MTHVSIKELTKIYPGSTEPSLDRLCLEIGSGELVALLGPSGCGKTTTMKMIAGLLPVTRGDVTFDGRSILRDKPEHRGVVMVFQNYLLFPYMSVAAAAAKTWEILNDLEPYLWREGQTYPATITALQQLFANREVSLYFSYDASSFGQAVEDGTFPPSVRSYGLSDGTIGNTNYTLIPVNSPNKAAAMVLQNVLLSGMAQFEKARPEVWGAAPAIDITRTSADIQASFASLVQHPSVVSNQELGKAALPELQASWISEIEKGWQENVGQ